MEKNWGDCYLDHYTHFLRNFVEREIFRQNETTPSIQILAYDGVFKGCRVFCTLGLSHYGQEIGDIAEVVLPVDRGWDVAPRLLANALFFAVQKRIVVGRGMIIRGLAAIDNDFVETYSKSALYFTVPYGLPEDFSQVNCGAKRGNVYLAFFISPAECDYFNQNGTSKFEELLQSKNVDPYETQRSSCV